MTFMQIVDDALATIPKMIGKRNASLEIRLSRLQHY